MTILYTILLDENELYHTLHNLDILMLIVALLGILAILVIAKIRSKEERLSEQDKFVQSAMHEIKTPLSVITLNNELRAMEYGKDPYTEEIDSALRTLQNSYDTMSFIITKDAIRYPVETLSLKEVLQERVDFFQNIAHSNHRSITLHTSGNIDVKMSRIELVRLIDNNLSNALKYSFERTEITVTLQDRTLTFHNYGNTVTDKERIFEKYARENNTVGGYGLGLNIVKDIARKYHIIIDLRSNKKEGTTFSYIFPRTKGKNA
jgi:signal transduction histidine kinase